MSTRKLSLTCILGLRLGISCCRLRLKLSLTRNFNFTILFTSPRHLVKPYQESILLILNLNYFLCEIGYNTSCASKVNAKRLCVYIIKIFTHVIKTFYYWFHRGRAWQTALTSALKIERKVVFHNSTHPNAEDLLPIQIYAISWRRNRGILELNNGGLKRRSSIGYIHHTQIKCKATCQPASQPLRVEFVTYSAG